MKSFLAAASWLNPPVGINFDGEALRIKSAGGSDFWQETHYGFKRDSGHALLAPTETEGSLEVTFRASFETLYDQAGLMIRNGETDWIKAGIELSDGIPHAGAVVTHGQSDWSLGPVPDWADQDVTIRASWRAGAVTIRAKCGNNRWNTLRLTPFAVGSSTQAGLYVCSPEREGLELTFLRVAFGPADSKLHSQP